MTKQEFLQRLSRIIDGFGAECRNTSELGERFKQLLAKNALEIAKLLGISNPEDGGYQALYDETHSFALFLADSASRTTPQNSVAMRDAFNRTFLSFRARIGRLNDDAHTR